MSPGLSALPVVAELISKVSLGSVSKARGVSTASWNTSPSVSVGDGVSWKWILRGVAGRGGVEDGVDGRRRLFLGDERPKRITALSLSESVSHT